MFKCGEMLKYFQHDLLKLQEKVHQISLSQRAAKNEMEVNRDFVNSNVGLKNQHILKMDMKKIDGKDPVTWILQMEQYFDLNNVQNTQRYASKLYI